MPLEVRRLGRTHQTLARQIVAWHHAKVSNGPTEAVNNLVNRVKRVAFGFRRSGNHRIRALLYAGKPAWTLLDAIGQPHTKLHTSTSPQEVRADFLSSTSASSSESNEPGSTK
jgi:hypothetical protein